MDIRDSSIVGISAQGEALTRLAARSAELQAKMNALASQLGLLSQEYLIINEAMRLTLEEVNKTNGFISSTGALLGAEG